MEFEGLICPKCSGSLDEKLLAENLSCPHCNTKFHNKKYIAFIEYLMMNGIVTDIDFFDRTLYGDEIKYKSETEEELLDETNPDEYEDKTFRMKYMDDNPELAEEQNKDDGVKDLGKLKTIEQEDEEDWQDFNKRKQAEIDKKRGKGARK